MVAVARRLKTFDMVAAFKPRRPPPPVRREAAVTYNVLVIRVGFRSITGANVFVPCEEDCAMVRGGVRVRVARCPAWRVCPILSP
jgi:hypothetical protein